MPNNFLTVLPHSKPKKREREGERERNSESSKG